MCSALKLAPVRITAYMRRLPEEMLLTLSDECETLPGKSFSPLQFDL